MRHSRSGPPPRPWVFVLLAGSGILGLRHPRSSVWRGLCSGLSVSQCQAFPALNTPSVDRSVGSWAPQRKGSCKVSFEDPGASPCMLPSSGRVGHAAVVGVLAANHSLSILFFTCGSRRAEPQRENAGGVWRGSARPG